MRAPRHQHGSALIFALFVLTLLTGMGSALLFLSQHEARTSRAALREKKAFYLAEAGLEDARMVLLAANADGDLDDDLAAAAGGDLALDFDPSTIVPSYDAQGNVTGFTGYDDDVPLTAYTSLHGADGRGWYAAFLTNDPAEGPTVENDANDRVMITAIGAGADQSVEVVQAIVEPRRILPPAPPAAITLLGPLPAFYDNGNSNAQSHTGDDCGVPGGAFAPIIGTVSPQSRAEVQDDMNRPENFSAGPGSPPQFEGEETVADLTHLSDPIVAAAGHGIIDPVWTDCLALKQMIEQLALSADHYCNADSTACTLPSTPAPDTVVFIDGDLTNTPAGAYTGILVVTGELTYNGNTGWDGLVLAVGEGRVIRSGGGSGVPTGGLVVANIDPTPDGPATDRSDWCSTGAGGFEQSFYDTSGGGDSTVQWCSTALEAANSIRTYRVSQFLQR